MTQRSNIPERPVTSYPFYWFAMYEQAVERGDYAAAADAQRELRRMGVDVRPVRRKREAPHA